ALFHISLVLVLLLGLMLLPGDAAAGWRHGYGGYGYGGYRSCGYGYGGYGYGAYGSCGYGYGGYGYGGYGYYGGGYWGGYAGYSPAVNYPYFYSGRTYSYGSTETSPSDMRPGSGLAYGAEQNTRQPYRTASSSGGPATVVEVAAQDNYFQTNSLTVKPGTTVRWTNRGTHPHTVTSNHDLFDSGEMQPGATYSATFQHPGNYYYYCRHHTGEAMRGMIVVQPEDAPVASQQPAAAAAETARQPGTAGGPGPAQNY
ncbi:MAG TPA: plastocyanin/azurin family copper-binding protein, partial [Pirellulaceae bacterium]|nr:plastocyanin/azurin family copper-binding protein [Pirellulaceae bacterium]